MGEKPIAHELAKKQKQVSVAEFFEKNRHLLGYANKSQALLTSVKELVDNSLDAAEEANTLPEIKITLSEVDKERYRLVVEDNGPGIVKQQIPQVFGRFLYGSKFGANRQSRGQQGIGVSSVLLYSQLTTGKPTIITSKIAPDEPAHKITMHLDVKKNEPEIVSSEEVEWSVDHGTRVEFVLEGKYIDTKQSVPEYIKQTAIVNPHARIIFINPTGQKIEYPRVTEIIPKKSKSVKPHPYGTELGVLKRMLTATSSRSIKSFLINEFDKVGSGSADEILKIANLDPKIMPKLLTPEQIEALLNGMQEAKIQNPSTDCLSPIGDEILKKSLESEYDLEFAHAITRSPAVYRGISFEVEVSIGYGGELDKEGRIALGRFANRVPLLYQEGACAITKAIREVNWKQYGLQQSGDNLPQGPAIVIVHIASVWVPFTSEGKEAVASYPEIIKEIKLAVQECGRRLQLFVSRKQKSAIEARKREIFKNYSHELAASLAKITGKNEEKIKENLLKIAESMYTASDEEGEEVEIEEERKSTSDEESEEVEE